MIKNEKKYLYSAYGLSIQSQIEFPEFFINLGDSEQIDIIISVGVAPEKASIVGHQKPISAYNKDEYWQEIPNVARYYAQNGNAVIIEPLCDNWQDIRLFFVSNVLAAILFQRNLFPMAGSGVLNTDNEVILFLGSKLVGKSTLLLQFFNKGYKPILDGFFVIEPFLQNDEDAFVNKSFNFISMEKNTVNQLDISKEIIEFPLRKNINRIGLRFSENSLSEKYKIKAIVILQEKRSELEISVRKSDAKNAFLDLHECHYRPAWIEDLKKHVENFIFLTFISKKVPIYKATRPFDKDTFNGFFNEIESVVFQ